MSGDPADGGRQTAYTPAKITNQLGDFPKCRFQQEVPAVQQVDLGPGEVVGERARAVRPNISSPRPHTASSGTPEARK